MTFMPVLTRSHFMKHRIELRWGIFGNYTFQAYNFYLFSPPEGIQSYLLISAFCNLLRGAAVNCSGWREPLLSSSSVCPKHPSLPLWRQGDIYVHLESFLMLITGKNDSFHFKCNFREKIIEYWNWSDFPCCFPHF